jgi:hypothetical protein
MTNRLPFEFLSEKDFSEQINRLLKTLNERETTIIAHRFGLNGTAAKSLEQVGELIGVTHERVRRLELAALGKLRRAFNKHLGPVESEVFRRSMTDDLDAYEPLTMGIRCMDLSSFRKDKA